MIQFIIIMPVANKMYIVINIFTAKVLYLVECEMICRFKMDWILVFLCKSIYMIINNTLLSCLLNIKCTYMMWSIDHDFFTENELYCYQNHVK